MTTASYDTRLRHDSDANYREWVQEHHDQCVAAGLVQTSDTGQADIPTLTRPASGSVNAYEIFRFDDSLQGSAPIFIRFNYGTGGGSASTPKLQAAVGTGTDGAGNLTATGIAGTAVTTARDIHASSQGGFSNSDTVRPSRMCHAEGFFGLSWKNIAAGAGFALPGLFAVCRTCDASGVPDGRGVLLTWGAAGNVTTQAVRFAGTEPFGYAVQTGTGANYGFFPMAPTATTVSGDFQAGIARTWCDGAEALINLCGVDVDEHALHSTFSVTLFGSTSHTYIVIPTWVFGHPTAARVAMLWE